MKDVKINNINSLTQKGIVSKELLVLISNMTLEDLIAIKLELSSTHLKNRLFGLDIWKKIDYIIKEALMRVAISCTKSNSEAARFLGITLSDYRINLKKFNMYKE
jgi:hypothetical protein|tara:strand:- start:366 stop:680 length:315 start_codon:yes stop_codon:yes gene_type:complete